MIFICIMFKFLAKRNNLPAATAKFILFNIYFKTPDALGFQGDAYLKYLSIIFWLEISTQIHFSNQSNPGVPKTANLVFPLCSANSGLKFFLRHSVLASWPKITLTGAEGTRCHSLPPTQVQSIIIANENLDRLTILFQHFEKHHGKKIIFVQEFIFQVDFTFSKH